jgi:hypothetical protein
MALQKPDVHEHFLSKTVSLRTNSKGKPFSEARSRPPRVALNSRGGDFRPIRTILDPLPTHC